MKITIAFAAHIKYVFISKFIKEEIKYANMKQKKSTTINLINFEHLKSKKVL